MPLEPTHDELIAMQQVHDALEKSSELQQRVLADPKGPEELLRRLVESRGKPGTSEISRLIWEESRFWAAEALSKMARRDAVPMLLRALESDDHWSVEAAMKYLGRLKDPAAVQPLAERIRDPRVSTRRAAVLALGEIATPAAAKALKKAAVDPDVGISAAFNLLEMGTPEAIGAVVDLISDRAQGEHLRKEASLLVNLTHRFRSHPAPEFTEALRTLLKDRQLKHRKEVAKALELIENAGAPDDPSESFPSREEGGAPPPTGGIAPLGIWERILTWVKTLIHRLQA